MAEQGRSSAKHCFGWTLSRHSPEQTGLDAGLSAGFVPFFLNGQNNPLNHKYVTVVCWCTKRLGCLFKRGRFMIVFAADEQSSALAAHPALPQPERSLPPGRHPRALSAAPVARAGPRGGRRRQRSPAHLRPGPPPHGVAAGTGPGSQRCGAAPGSAYPALLPGRFPLSSAEAPVRAWTAEEGAE